MSKKKKSSSNGKGPDPMGRVVVLTFQGFRIQLKVTHSRWNFGRWDVRYDISKVLKEPATSDWAQFPIG